MKRNCNCTSPKKLFFSYRARLPEAGNYKKWKLFVKNYVIPDDLHQPGYRDEMIKAALKGTRFENLL